MKQSSDVVIVGGGVVGTAIAYFLSQRSERKVTLIDLKKPGNASWASAGGLWPIGESVGLGCGVIFFKTLSKRNQESGAAPVKVIRPHQLPDFFFDFCLKSNAMFPALWKELRETTGADFKLERTGLKFVMYDQDDQAYAQQIFDSIPHLADQMRWLSRAELQEDEPYVTDRAVGALQFLNDDQVNPYLLVEAYRSGARANGVRFVDGEEVLGVEVQAGRVTAVKTKHATVGCDLMINAAGAWADQVANMVGLSIPVYPVRGQIVLSERLPKSVLNSCLSTSDCYIAQKDNGEVLIGSTTEEMGFDTSCGLEQLRGLCEGAARALPVLKNVNIKRTWAGLRPGTPDEVPVLGPVRGLEGYLNACGHFRTGILTSAITAEIIRALVYDEALPVPLEPFLLERFAKKAGEVSDAAPPAPRPSSPGFALPRLPELAEPPQAPAGRRAPPSVN